MLSTYTMLSKYDSFFTRSQAYIKYLEDLLLRKVLFHKKTAAKVIQVN